MPDLTDQIVMKRLFNVQPEAPSARFDRTRQPVSAGQPAVDIDLATLRATERRRQQLSPQRARKVEACRQKIMAGQYDDPAVLDAVVDAILSDIS